jgi:hypothetical protein
MSLRLRYILNKGSKKYKCPQCGKLRFVKYIDTITGEYLPEQYGRCDREINCAYHLNPYTDGFAKNEKEKLQNLEQKTLSIKKALKKTKPIFIPFEVLNETLNHDGYEQNSFIQNLFYNIPFPFETKDVEKVISQYYLGTICNGYRAGAITFPYIDKIGNVRTIQVKQFDRDNHTKGTDFLHSILEKKYIQKRQIVPTWLKEYKKNESKVSCLFGEHLLNKYTMNPVALVEAPKTAIYSTLYFGFPEQSDNLLWLAVFNLSSLSLEKCKVLQGRNVILFPDLSKDGRAYELWKSKAKDFSDLLPSTCFKMSDLLETLASNELRNVGADIADVLINLDWRKFRHQQFEQPKGDPSLLNKCEQGEKGEKGAPVKTNFILKSKDYSLDDPLNAFKKIHNLTWNKTELEHFNSNLSCPTGLVNLNSCSKITDFNKFIISHFGIVKARDSNQRYLPYYERLIQLSSQNIKDKN